MDVSLAPARQFASSNTVILSGASHPVPYAHQASLEEPKSPEDAWSGQDSGNDGLEQNDSSSARGLKRKRPVIVSCELCKQRKVKCDRAQPSCGWCTRNGQLCEYRERKKPGLRAGYGKELEQRLDRLEGIIQAQARLIETHIIRGGQHNQNSDLHPDARSYSSPSEPSLTHGPSPRITHPLQENYPAATPPQSSQHIGNRPQDVSYSTSPTRVPDNLGNKRLANGMPLPSGLQQSIDTTQNGYPTHQISTPSIKVPLPLYPSHEQQQQQLTSSDIDLPPYDLLYSLVDLYFEHINTWCPILHRRSTMDTFFGPSPLEEEDRMILYAIVATTLRFSTDTRLNDNNRQRYHDSSKQKVLLYGLENSSVKALQALVVLALDLVGSSHGPPGWKLLALIARSVVQLGLAAESTSSLVANMFPSIYTLRANILPDPKNWIEDESRRRLFWMAYLLDRYSTIATAFDFALSDKEVERRLPCKDEFFTKNQAVDTRWFMRDAPTDYGSQGENMGSFGFWVEMWGILSRIHLFLKRPVDIGLLSDVEQWQSTYRKLDDDLVTWEYNLPAEYAYENASRMFNVSKSSRAVHCGWVSLHAAFQTAVIRLHSAAAYPTTRSQIFTPSYSASQRCLGAVDKIHALTHFVVDNNVLDKLGPPFAFTLWVCARLLLIHGSTIAHTLSPNINFFVDILRRMGKYWKVAERYTTILQRVLDEYSEYEQSVSAGGERVTPSTVKILADMRRTAFDLDFLISNQPRATIANAYATADTQRPPLPISTRNLGPNELEYLDVFGFFNVPRVPLAPSAATATTQMHLEALDSAAHRANQNGTSPNTSMTPANQLPVGDLGTTAVAVPLANEFNITNYMVPTPETDWLFRNPT